MVRAWTLATTLIVLSLVAFKLIKLSCLCEFIRLNICIFQQVCSTSTSFFMKWYSWKVAVWFQGHWLGVIDRTVSNFCLTQLYCSEQGLTQTVLKAESKTRRRHLHWIVVCSLEWCAVIFASNGCKRCKHSSLVYLQVLLHFASYSCFPLYRTENLTEEGANSFIIIEGPRSLLPMNFMTVLRFPSYRTYDWDSRGGGVAVQWLKIQPRISYYNQTNEMY